MGRLSIQEANRSFREGKYDEAEKQIHELISKEKNSILQELLDFNLRLLARRAGVGIKEDLVSPAEHSLVFDSHYFDEVWYLSKYAQKIGFSNAVSRADLVKHYLSVGHKKGFDPSAYFSNNEYLEKNPSLKKNSINPLLHYIKYGKMKGWKVYKSRLVEEREEQGAVDIYVSCWLRNQEPLHDLVLELYDGLRSFGKRVKLVTHSDYLLDKEGIDAIDVSFSLLSSSLYSSYESNASFTTPHDIFSELLESILFILKKTKKKYNEADFLRYRKSIDLAYSYWDLQFKTNSPSCIIVWGSTCPMSKLHIYLCNKYSIPYLVMERGHFSGTLYFDTLGQFVHGGSNRLPVLPLNDKSFKDVVKKWIFSNTEVPHALKNKEKLDELEISSLKKQGYKVCLFIGSNDSGSGIVYKDSPVKEKHSSVFGSSLEALLYVSGVIELLHEKIIVIVKPHPADNEIKKSFFNEDFLFKNDVNINDLIQCSDVCITLNTTAVATCVAYQKPIVTMAESDLSGYQVAYECYDKTDLLPNLRLALSGVDSDVKTKNGMVFLQDLFRRKIFFSNRLSSLGFNTIHSVCERVNSLSKLNNYTASSETPVCKYRKYMFGVGFSVPEIAWRGVSLIIPVYGDEVVTKLALDSAISAAQNFNDVDIIIVNDCSPDEKVWELLESYRKLDKVKVFDNEKNIGFSGTVNKGIKLAGDKDVILLNSDAIMPSKEVINELRLAAYSHYKIATVTPFSNNASIFSLPTMQGFSLPVESAKEITFNCFKVLQELSEKCAVEVPVGHGFCLYIKRWALELIGSFDEKTFGAGYSEEVDFCLRLRKLGYINALASSVFVGHVGGVSFKETAHPRKIKNRKIIQGKYPDYFPEIKSFLEKDPISLYRQSFSNIDTRLK